MLEKTECRCSGSQEVKATVLGINLCEKCIFLILNDFNEVKEKIDKLRG